MDQYRSRLKLSENFERHWSIRISGEIHMDQSLVHTFSWGNSYGPMVLKVLLEFPPTLVLVRGWLFPVPVFPCRSSRFGVGRRGSPRFVPISPVSSDFFQFPLLLFRNALIRSDFFRFPLISSDLFSDQIRTDQGNPFLPTAFASPGPYYRMGKIARRKGRASRLTDDSALGSQGLHV